MATNMITYTKHAVCESSKIKATTCGHIFNVEAHKDLDNGSVVKLGDYLRAEVYKALEPTASDAVVLVLTTPLIYEEYTTKMQHEYNFYNAMGDIMRCYELVPRDIFSVSVEGIEGTPAVGKFIVANGTKLAVADSDAGNAFAGRIIEKAANGAYRIEVLRNEATA